MLNKIPLQIIEYTCTTSGTSTKKLLYLFGISAVIFISKYTTTVSTYYLKYLMGITK